MTGRSDSACVVLGMSDLAVMAVTEGVGEIHILVETGPGPVGCWTCGTRAESKGRRMSRIGTSRSLDALQVVPYSWRNYPVGGPSLVAGTPSSGPLFVAADRPLR
jgi:hypothetical protein